MLFRALRQAEIVRVERGAAGRPAVARVDADLQRDFDLHHTLSLYLVDAVSALDPAAEDYALDVLSVVEAILENPRALLQAQVRQRKTELINELKAERVPYEERMEKLEGVTWDKPNADFLYSTFDVFRTHHPWAGDDSISPKSIAREIWEGFLSFDDYVRRYGIARMEGVLLRYLSQVHSTLARNMPESARNDELIEVIAFFRAMLARIDSSLVEEWENLVNPTRGARPDGRSPPGSCAAKTRPQELRGARPRRAAPAGAGPVACGLRGRGPLRRGRRMGCGALRGGARASARGAGHDSDRSARHASDTGRRSRHAASSRMTSSRS